MWANQFKEFSGYVDTDSDLGVHLVAGRVQGLDLWNPQIDSEARQGLSQDRGHNLLVPQAVA